MNKIIEWFTKKKMMIISFIMTIFSIIFHLNIPYKFLCTPEFLYCGDTLKFLKILFLIMPVIFIFSLISFFTKDINFYNWKKFTFIYLLIYLIIIILAPSSGGDFIKLTKGVMGIVFTFLYSVISLILIISQSLKNN